MLQVKEATARCAIKLGDALGRVQRSRDGEDGSGEPVREVQTPDAPNSRGCGFRFQKCGGGRRVIRKQRQRGN